MAYTGNQPLATDVEGGRAYPVQEGISDNNINNDTVLPTYNRNQGLGAASSGGSSSDEGHHKDGGKEVVDLSTVDPPHEEEYTEKSWLSKKLSPYSHIRRPLIHAAIILFGLGESRDVRPLARSGAQRLKGSSCG